MTTAYKLGWDDGYAAGIEAAARIVNVDVGALEPAGEYERGWNCCAETCLGNILALAARAQHGSIAVPTPSLNCAGQVKPDDKPCPSCHGSGTGAAKGER